MDAPDNLIGLRCNYVVQDIVQGEYHCLSVGYEKVEEVQDPLVWLTLTKLGLFSGVG